MLASELHRNGWPVTVVSTTPYEGPEPFPFRIVRRPGPFQLLRLTRWCNVYFQANVSLKALWPLILVRRPWVVSHHSWYRQADGRITWRDRLKRRLLRHAAASISVSRAVAEDLETPSQVVENPYRDDLFRRSEETERDRELVFVGRLVSDKGCDLLVEALAILRERSLRPRASIVGAGPEAHVLCQKIEDLGLSGQVEMLGTRTGIELVRLLNAHRILVVPSRYEEPFGIVALEGMACGCLVVGSRGGGLPDAIGPGGWTYANGDVAALADLLARVLSGDQAPPSRTAVAAHLDRHTVRQVGSRYKEILESVVGTPAHPADSPEP
jgi:glycosyltransferase involved in cell wall biosynthesis